MRWNVNDPCGETGLVFLDSFPLFYLQLSFHCCKADCCLKNASQVPKPGVNPSIGCLNYILVNLPKILSHYTLSEWLGLLPAGISSPIGFQLNALKCRLTAFSISHWCLLTYCCIKVFSEIKMKRLYAQHLKREKQQSVSSVTCTVIDGFFFFIFLTATCNNLLDTLNQKPKLKIFVANLGKRWRSSELFSWHAALKKVIVVTCFGKALNGLWRILLT